MEFKRVAPVMVVGLAGCLIGVLAWAQAGTMSESYDQREGGPPPRSGQRDGCGCNDQDRGPQVDGRRPGPPPPRRDELRADEGRGRPQASANDQTRIVDEQALVRLSGGYQTDQRDGGRPVGLIAAALNVEPTVFRDAFSNVRPARVGAPSHSRQQQNKQVLMDALSPHGITNNRLDAVSNYYRYRPETGELWTHRDAKLEAVIKDGQLLEIKILDGGSGYLSPPKIEVVGYERVDVKVELDFGTDLESNGCIKSIQVQNEVEI